MFGLKKKRPEDPATDAGAAAVASAPAGDVTGAVMPGRMQGHAINLASILEHAAAVHGTQEVVTAALEGGMRRQTYASLLTRTKKLANALQKLGAAPGHRIGTLAWNTDRHLEAWYAISGQGAVCHTVNPRLFPEQIAYIIGHAEDSIVFFDITFAPLVAALRDKLPAVKTWIAMTDRAHMPEGDYVCYEELIAEESDQFAWPEVSEATASSLCYTSGTTGDPKGVLYSHRSNLLQAYAIAQKDVMNMGAQDVALMVVPMFHANSWGMAYGVPMVGAKLVLPGMALDGASSHRIIKEEGVTMSAAVPTVWNMLLHHLEKEGGDLKPLREVMIGGSAVPRAMIDVFDQRYGVSVIHAWGMTEMSPLGTVNRPTPGEAGLDREAWLDRRCKQGRPPFGVELRIVNDAGEILPNDGKTPGRLLVRGPWVVAQYFGRDEVILDADGFFDTGDIATLDADGFMEITDRAKDVIKSGGEWISSVELENAAMAHPDVAMACAFGVKHAKWEERPILLIVAKEGTEPSPESILEAVGRTVAKWQLPDDVVFVPELPLTATGKLDKKVLRVKYAEHLLTKEPAE